MPPSEISLYVNLLQERLHRSAQMNGGSYHGPNINLHPPVPPRSSSEGYNHPPNALSASSQSTFSPYVPASRILQDTQQQPEALAPVKLTCKQCQKQFGSKPEVLQFKVRDRSAYNALAPFCAHLKLTLVPRLCLSESRRPLLLTSLLRHV